MCLSRSLGAPISKSPMRKYYRRSSSRFGRTVPRGDMFLQPLCIGLGLMPMQCIARLPGVRVPRSDPFAAMLQWLFHTLQTNVSTSQKVEPHNSLRGRLNEINDCKPVIGTGFLIQKAIFMVKAQLLDDNRIDFTLHLTTRNFPNRSFVC